MKRTQAIGSIGTLTVALLISLIWFVVVPSFHFHHSQRSNQKPSILDHTIINGVLDKLIVEPSKKQQLYKRADESSSIFNSSSTIDTGTPSSSIDIFSTTESTSSDIFSSESSESPIFFSSSEESSLSSSTISEESSFTSEESSSILPSSTSSSSSFTPSSSSSEITTSSTASSSSSITSSSQSDSTSINEEGRTIIINLTSTLTEQVSATTVVQPTSSTTTQNSRNNSSSGGLSKKNRDIVIGVVVGIGVPILIALAILFWWKFIKSRSKNNFFINSEGELISRNQYKKQKHQENKNNLGGTVSKFEPDDMIDEKVFDDTVLNDDAVTGFEGDTYVNHKTHSRGPSLQNTHVNY